MDPVALAAAQTKTGVDADVHDRRAQRRRHRIYPQLHHVHHYVYGWITFDDRRRAHHNHRDDSVDSGKRHAREADGRRYRYR